jgi:tetratricopeptide (TPR) repeat protein
MSVRVELTSITRQFVTLELKPADGPAQPTSTDAPSGSVVSTAELNMPPKAKAELLKGQKALQERKIGESISHLLEQKSWKDAQAALERALQLDPKLSDAYLELGAVFNQTADYPKAEAALKHGLELSPDAAGGHYELAKTYWAMGKWQDAAPHAKTAVSALPGLAPPHVLYGNVLLRQNDPQSASREYQEYLRLEPNGPMAAGAREMIAKIQKATAPH